MNKEEIVLDLLSSYRRLTARMKQLEKTSVGPGIRLSAVSEDDKLQELHRELRKLSSCMYLDERELQIESAAHANLTKYPLGTRAQLKEVKRVRESASPEDEQLLKELESKIKKVLEARAGSSSSEGYRGVLDKISELQDLERRKREIDEALEALEEFEPQYAQLLKLRYIEGKQAEFVASELGIVDRTFRRWKQKAVQELVRFMSA
ncbi:ECF-type sigma factor [Paenibacillus harenae]|uniref:ECF-type sigma factor n=1 Tax=Paenibacillus harenae TaxID=306543 RepID=UPI0027908B23|nr:ECF-type sigma factor [Paenibacillus harenae]MDQ0063552.1 DNA-directed RNA polymerase specialized sigma24 family protein [Paenibacillus harenae]